MTQNLERIRSIKSFPSLVKYLRDELDWDFETEDIDDLMYEYNAAEFGLNSMSAAVEKNKRILTANNLSGDGLYRIRYKGYFEPILSGGNS